MPRIVRSMYKASDGKPEVGSHRRCLLGVRPTGNNADVDLDPPGDTNGNVMANGKGLSVVDDWRKLASYQIPEELDDGFNGACGKNMAVYVHGEGPFVAGALTEMLELAIKSHRPDAGVIAPTATMLLTDYQSALAAT